MGEAFVASGIDAMRIIRRRVRKIAEKTERAMLRLGPTQNHQPELLETLEQPDVVGALVAVGPIIALMKK